MQLLIHARIKVNKLVKGAWCEIDTRLTATILLTILHGVPGIIYHYAYRTKWKECPMDSPHKGPVMRKVFRVIKSSCSIGTTLCTCLLLSILNQFLQNAYLFFINIPWLISTRPQSLRCSVVSFRRKWDYHNRATTSGSPPRLGGPRDAVSMAEWLNRLDED